VNVACPLNKLPKESSATSSEPSRNLIITESSSAKAETVAVYLPVAFE